MNASGDPKTAVVAMCERDDGRLLCVWNPRYGGWSFPGGLREPADATDLEALMRELYEECGVHLADTSGAFAPVLLYEGPHGISNPDPTRASIVKVYRCTLEFQADPREMESGCPVTWLTRQEFFKWSPFAAFYKRIIGQVPDPEMRNDAPIAKREMELAALRPRVEAHLMDAYEEMVGTRISAFVEALRAELTCEPGYEGLRQTDRDRAIVITRDHNAHARLLDWACRETPEVDAESVFTLWATNEQSDAWFIRHCSWEQRVGPEELLRILEP